MDELLAQISSGDSWTLPTAILSAAAVIIAAVIKFVPARNGKHGSHADGPLAECLSWRGEMNQALGRQYTELRNLMSVLQERLDSRMNQSDVVLARLEERMRQIADELKKP